MKSLSDRSLLSLHVEVYALGMEIDQHSRDIAYQKCEMRAFLADEGLKPSASSPPRITRESAVVISLITDMHIDTIHEILLLNKEKIEKCEQLFVEIDSRETDAAPTVLFYLSLRCAIALLDRGYRFPSRLLSR